MTTGPLRWLLLLSWLGAAAPASTLRYSADFSRLWEDGHWRGETWNSPGQPMVPVMRVSILLPYGEELVSARFEPGPESATESLRETFRTASRPRTVCGGDWREPSAWSAPLPEIFPAQRLAPTTYVTSQFGYRVAHASLFPLQLDTATGRARTIQKGGLILETRAGAKPELYRGLRADRERVASELTQERSYRQQETLATYPVTRAPATLDYLIISPQNFLDDNEPNSLDRLLFEKNSRGVRAATLSVEKIQQAYPGRDLQAKVRAAITEYYKTRGIRYVLLVGNGYSILPTKTLYVNLGNMNGALPSDYYFACLDGELHDTEPDLTCEVAVGRAPVTTLDDLHVFVRKTSMMQAFDEDDPRLGNLLNYGEELDEKTLGGPIINQVLTGGTAGTLSTVGYPQSTAVRKLYETHTRNYTEREVIEAINIGQFYTVNHIGHADESLCMRLNAVSIPKLDNDIPFFTITQGCHPGNISVPNWASKLMNHPTGGAGAIIANSNYGFYAGEGSADGPSNRFTLAFYDSYFRDGLKTLGELSFRAKQKISPQVQNDKTMLWVMYETNLLGDPELELKLPRH